MGAYGYTPKHLQYEELHCSTKECSADFVQVEGHTFRMAGGAGSASTARPNLTPNLAGSTIGSCRRLQSTWTAQVRNFTASVASTPYISMQYCTVSTRGELEWRLQKQVVHIVEVPISCKSSNQELSVELVDLTGKCGT